jgi:hypothetical protein
MKESSQQQPQAFLNKDLSCYANIVSFSQKSIAQKEK